MADVIEASPSGRATCRTCKKKIDKGVVRFGEETPNAFDPEGDMTYRYHHLTCAAAGKLAPRVRVELEARPEVVPNRAEIEALLNAPPSKGAGKAPAGNYPYLERASTGRSNCVQCESPIEKGAWRLAVEREIDTGSFTRKGPGYLHVGCAVENTGEDDIVQRAIKNSAALTPADLADLETLEA